MVDSEGSALRFLFLLEEWSEEDFLRFFVDEESDPDWCADIATDGEAENTPKAWPR